MGNGDRHTRRTKPFDSAQLARLARKPAPETEIAFDDLDVPVEVKPGEPLERVALSRATTVHDPLTTQLLAEVARRSQTMEVTPEAEAARADADEADAADAEPTPPKRKRR